MYLQELICQKRTIRRFLQKPVSDEIVQDLLNAARCAASAANLQPLQYAVIKTPQTVTAVFSHTRWAGYLPADQGHPKPEERPVLFIAVLCDQHVSQKWCEVDAGLALANLTLSAWGHGVGSCIIGALNKEEIAALLKLPENLSIHSVVAFGYPAHKSTCIELDETGSVKYRLDENRDYLVPKRKLCDTVTYY